MASSEDWFDPGDESTPLDDGTRRLLQKHFPSLTRDLTPRPVMDHMISDLVIDFDDYEAVDTDKTPRKEKAIKLIRLVEKSNLKCYKSFKRALRHVQPHLAKYLDEAPPPAPAQPRDSDEDLDTDQRYRKRVTDDFVTEIYTKIGLWGDLAVFLKIPEAERDRIKSDKGSDGLHEQVHTMINAWRNRSAPNDTYRVFINALKGASKPRDVIDQAKRFALQQEPDETQGFVTQETEY